MDGAGSSVAAERLERPLGSVWTKQAWFPGALALGGSSWVVGRRSSARRLGGSRSVAWRLAVLSSAPRQPSGRGRGSEFALRTAPGYVCFTVLACFAFRFLLQGGTTENPKVSEWRSS